MAAPAAEAPGAAAVAPGRIGAPERDPRRWLMFTIVSVAFMMSSIDQTIVATALPALQRDLHANLNWVGWTITTYALGRVLVLPLAGRLSDQYSRRVVFLAAIVVFTVASLGCGLVSNVYALIVLRAVQSVGGGAFMPSATGIVADRFGPDRDRAVGLFSSIFPVGGVIGPVLGAVLVAYWSWRGIFLVNVPIGVALFFVARRYLPVEPRRESGTRLDVTGMLLVAAAILAAMLAVTYLGEPDAPLLRPALLVPAAVAVGAGAAVAVHIRRARAPFISAELLHGRGLGALSVINFLYGGAALGLAALVPLYASQRYGIGTLASGTLLTARAIGMMVAAGLAVLALRRGGYRLPIVLGFVVTAAGLFAMAAPPVAVSAYLWLAVSAAATGVGMGIATPASNNASMEIAPDQVAAITGLRAMFRQAGAISAVSVTTAILSRAGDPGIAQAYICAAYALVVLAVLPLVRYVPGHRGTW